MVDLEKIQQLVRMMTEHDLSEISLRDGGEEISLKRISSNAAPAMPVAPPLAAHAALAGPSPQPIGAQGVATQLAEGEAPPAQEETAADEGLVPIRSPMVGTFYTSPNPDAPPFVQVGSTVGANTVVCIIEAMKVFNEIAAEVSGTIERIVAADQEPVEYGQELFLVRPSS